LMGMSWRPFGYTTVRNESCQSGRSAAVWPTANCSCSAPIRLRLTAATLVRSPQKPSLAAHNHCGLGARRERAKRRATIHPNAMHAACASLACHRADFLLPACSSCCTGAAHQAARHALRVAGEKSEPGPEGTGEDRGQDKRAGTYLPAKPVCTWGCGGTAAGRLRAVAERKLRRHRAWPRAVFDAVRHSMLELVP
jgi:hypothetical protein